MRDGAFVGLCSSERLAFRSVGNSCTRGRIWIPFEWWTDHFAIGISRSRRPISVLDLPLQFSYTLPIVNLKQPTLIVPPAIFFLGFFSPSFSFSPVSVCTIRLSHTIQYTSKGASSA